MNDRQRIVLAITAGVLVLLFLFPSFTRPASSGASIGIGHAFLFAPPHRLARVDAPALAAEAFVVCAIGGIAWFACKGWEPNKNHPVLTFLCDFLGLKRGKREE